MLANLGPQSNYIQLIRIVTQIAEDKVLISSVNIALFRKVSIM